jgi:hypothetical protein
MRIDSSGFTDRISPACLVTQINYGGRVTDDNDRRLLMCILAKCYTPSVLTDGHTFSKSHAYTSPPASGEVASYLAHIRSLPAVDEPEVFGLSANAAVSFNLQVMFEQVPTEKSQGLKCCLSCSFHLT